MESIALKAVFVVCILVLQKPSHNSKERDHMRHLERRLKLWKDGDLDELVREGRVIQSRLKCKPSAKRETQVTRSFTKLMFEGNTRAALQLLSGCDRGKVLNLNDSADPSNPGYLVSDALRDKHHLPSHFDKNVFYQQLIHLLATQLCLMLWMRLLFVLLLSARWGLQDLQVWMLMNGGGCALFFMRLPMIFVLLSLCSHGGYVPLTSPLIYLPPFWHAA